MANEYELITSVTVNESLIRKIGDNQYLKVIPSEKIIEISTIEQKKITEPIAQKDEIIIDAYPKEVKLYKDKNNDYQYETVWETKDQEFHIPLNNLKTIRSLLEAKNLILKENNINLSNILSMIIKQDTLKKKIENIKEEI